MTHVDIYMNGLEIHLHESCRKKRGCRRKFTRFEAISTSLVIKKFIEFIPNRFKINRKSKHDVTKPQNFPLRGAVVTFTWFKLINPELVQNLPTSSFFFYISHVDISCRFGNPKKKVWFIPQFEVLKPETDQADWLTQLCCRPILEYASASGRTRLAIFGWHLENQIIQKLCRETPRLAKA